MDTFLPKGNEDRFEWGKKIPRKHHRLIKALEALAVGDLKKNSVGYLPLEQVSITHNCSGCNICSTLCPTGALSRVQKNNSVVISFNIRQCVGCGLCQEACPEKEVTLDEALNGYDRKLRETILFQC